MNKECVCGVCQKLAECRPQRQQQGEQPQSQIQDQAMLKRLYKATYNPQTNYSLIAAIKVRDNL